MKNVFTIIITFCFVATGAAQSKIDIKDFEILNNTSWKGTLMYKDYTSEKKTVLQTTMQVKVEKNKFITKTQYTYEPEANSREVMKIKKRGTYFGSQKVIKKETTKDGSIKITTSYKGRDNGKKADMYIIYVFNAAQISITKEVQYFNSKERFIRNKQAYSRI
tara:strand:+ start:17187 stop:17675 length:489 start_codon:yes stop_codon:yes gene_type:complete